VLLVLIREGHGVFFLAGSSERRMLAKHSSRSQNFRIHFYCPGTRPCFQVPVEGDSSEFSADESTPSLSLLKTGFHFFPSQPSPEKPPALNP